MASVSHQGMTNPGLSAFRGTDRAEDIGPFGALVAGRPRARATSGPSACELILLADAGFILPPQLYLPFGSLARIFASSAGKFFLKASTASSFCAYGAAAPRSWRSRAPSTRARPWSVERDGERLQEPPRQVLAPPAHDAVDRRDRAGLNNLRQCAAVIGVELRGCAR